MMREKSLDSLRGIAALIVVFHHAALTFPGGGENRSELIKAGFQAPNAWLYLTPLRLLVAGPAAVLVFFVLSGLVLAMSLIERPHTSKPAFIVKRFCRVWLPFAVAIVCSAGLSQFSYRGPVPDASLWFAGTWAPGSPSSYVIFQHLAMLGTNMTLDNPMWSLVHEMRVSLIFPWLVAITLWNWRLVLACTAFILVLSVKLTANLHLTGVPASMLMTTGYLFLFVTGIALAYRLAPLRHRIAQQRPLMHGALWVVALLLLVTCPQQTDHFPNIRTALFLFPAGIGAAMIVLLCAVEGRVMQALLGRVPLYLGRISYSLYLTHLVVIATIVRALHSVVSLPASVALSVALSIPVAHVFQILVESTAAEVGKRMASFVESGRYPSMPHGESQSSSEHIAR